jgi:hypothetical protein
VGLFPICSKQEKWSDKERTRVKFSDLVDQEAAAQKRDGLTAAEENRKALARLFKENKAKLEVLAQIAAWAQDIITDATFATMAYGVDLILQDGTWMVVTEKVEMHSLDSLRGLRELRIIDFAQVAKRVVELSREHYLELPHIPVELT